MHEHMHSTGLALHHDKRFVEIAETLIEDITDHASAVKAFEIAVEQWYKWITAPDIAHMG